MNRSGMVGGSMTNQQQNMMHLKPQQSVSTQSSEQQQQQQSSGIFSTATSLLSGASNAATGGLFGSRPNHPKGPQVTPQTGSSTSQQQPLNSKVFFQYIA